MMISLPLYGKEQIPMKKIFALLLALCMMTACLVTVHADNYHQTTTVDLDGFQTFQIPEPEGEVDPDTAYFTHEFTFTAKIDGSYCFHISVDQDEDDPYVYTLDVDCPTGYWDLGEGIAFQAKAGETYTVRFQYPTDDGRYPAFDYFMIYEPNHNVRDSLSLGESKTIQIPEPVDGVVDPGWTYYNLSFFFTPEESGTYRFLAHYAQDESAPYEIYMGVSSPEGYRELENGCEFDAVAGETYEMLFQYPIHDGRYPEFTFWVDTADGTYVPVIPETEPVAETEAPETVPETVPETIPETEPTVEEIPVGIDGKTILCCIGAVLLVGAAIALVILERKKNTSSDSL